MRWRSRSAVAAAILGIGVAGAFAFRRAPVSPPPPPAGPVHRAPAGPHFLEETQPPHDAARDPSDASSKDAADDRERFPSLAAISPFDRDDRTAPAIELACPERPANHSFHELLDDGPAVEMGPPPFGQIESDLHSGPRTHIVTDGDTLAGLAEEYLGDPQRAEEIYEANRPSLPDPDLLPIGVEIVIPSR